MKLLSFATLITLTMLTAAMDDIQKANYISTEHITQSHDVKMKHPRIIHTDGEFIINTDNGATIVDPININNPFGKMSIDQMKAFLEQDGYIYLSKNNQSEICLELKTRLKGSGPAVGEAAYWTAKAAGYAAYLAYLAGNPLAGMSYGQYMYMIEVVAQAARVAGTMAPTI